MRKRMYFLLVLAIARITCVNAQMRLGSSEAPNQSAVLDLNSDDQTAHGNASLGLALPRVSLESTQKASPLLSHVKGMLVYNTATHEDVTPGVYHDDGSRWIRQVDSIPPADKINLEGTIVYLGTNDESYSPIDGSGIIRYSHDRINIEIKVNVAPGYSQYLFIPCSTEAVTLPTFTGTINDGIYTKELVFSVGGYYNTIYIKYLIFGVK